MGGSAGGAAGLTTTGGSLSMALERPLRKSSAEQRALVPVRGKLNVPVYLRTMVVSFFKAPGAETTYVVGDKTI
jgi:hypothetical protein